MIISTREAFLAKKPKQNKNSDWIPAVVDGNWCDEIKKEYGVKYNYDTVTGRHLRYIKYTREIKYINFDTSWNCKVSQNPFFMYNPEHKKLLFVLGKISDEEEQLVIEHANNVISSGDNLQETEKSIGAPI